MSNVVTTVYVQETGHVLAAVTRTDPSAGNAKDLENQILKANGVVVRALQPAAQSNSGVGPPRIRNQGRTDTAPQPVVMPPGLFSHLGASGLTYSATQPDGNPLPAWITVNATSGELTFAATTPVSQNIRVTATNTGGLTDHEDFTLVIADATTAPVLLNPIASQTANVGESFEFILPDDTFFSVNALTFSIPTVGNSGALPVWLHFGGQVPTFAGIARTTDLGTTNVTIVATSAVGHEQATLGIAIRSRQQQQLQFLVPNEFLAIAEGPLKEPAILSQPRAYQVKDKSIVRLPDPAGLNSLTYALNNAGLRVDLGGPATEKLPIWVLVRKGEDVRVATGSLPKGDRSTSVGFTLDPAGSFDVLLLVTGYLPFQSKELMLNQPVIWSPPSS